MVAQKLNMLGRIGGARCRFRLTPKGKDRVISYLLALCLFIEGDFALEPSLIATDLKETKTKYDPVSFAETRCPATSSGRPDPIPYTSVSTRPRFHAAPFPRGPVSTRPCAGLSLPCSLV